MATIQQTTLQWTSTPDNNVVYHNASDNAAGKIHRNDTVDNDSVSNVVEGNNRAYIRVEGENTVEEDNAKSFDVACHGVADAEHNKAAVNDT